MSDQDKPDATAGRTEGPGKISDEQARLLDTVTAASVSGGASLSDVKHIVILMQENRSFDHYFGTLSGVRGFSDPAVLTQTVGGASYPVFDQFGFRPGTGVDATGYMQPFNLLNNPPTENGSDTNDIAHDWVTQHRSWNGGAMDSFIRAHLTADGNANGPVAMGYFTRSELSFYYALADAFTICDNYFCSVFGPTDPNRLMAFSASIDPAGRAGGPVITTASDPLTMTGTLNWKTMPEALLEAGVSWKVYNDPTGLLGLGVLSYFKNYTDPFSLTGLELIAKGLTPTYPDNFRSDVQNGTLPSVSWIVPPLAECEHPAAPPEWGEYLVQEILNILVSNPEVWAQTVFIVNYDENGGFFDHVPPVTAPPGTAGEYLTGTLPSSAGGIAGPVGLGFRTPCLVISPFTAGGYKYSGTLDHTSTLRLIETRFGVTVPNLSAWRRGATGDFTGALNLTRAPVTKVPSLPSTSIGSDLTVVAEAVLNALAGTLDVGIDYPLPTVNKMPSQETTPARPPSRKAERMAAQARRDLVLGGGGDSSKEREVWRAAFDGVRRVVYWPFALSDERASRAPEWLRGSLREHGIQAEVDAWLSLEGRAGAELETADLLFVGGGTTSRLLKHIREHGFRDHVAGFVARGGRYYGGSAGALIAGESIMIAALADNDSPAAASPAALGLFSGATVLPHADMFALTDIQSWARQLGQRIIAIPEAGGAHVRGDEWAAIGPGRVTLVWGEGHMAFEPGSRIPV